MQDRDRLDNPTGAVICAWAGDYFEVCSPPAPGVPVPALEVAAAAFSRAVAAGHGEDDFSRSIALHLASAGVPPPAP